MGLMEKIFGTYSDRELKKIEPLVNKVMSLEGEMEKLSDTELKEKTVEFKNRINKGETLDDLLPEAFAVCREASWRVLGMKHFRVQLLEVWFFIKEELLKWKQGKVKLLLQLSSIFKCFNRQGCSCYNSKWLFSKNSNRRTGWVRFMNF